MTDEIMMSPPAYASGPIFSPQTAMLPQGLSLLPPPPYPTTLVCFPYASLSPPMDPWHHRIHAPASCMGNLFIIFIKTIFKKKSILSTSICFFFSSADLGIHAAAFGIMDRPMESPLIGRDDLDPRQQMALLQAANN